MSRTHKDVPYRVKLDKFGVLNGRYCHHLAPESRKTYFMPADGHTALERFISELPENQTVVKVANVEGYPVTVAPPHFSLTMNPITQGELILFKEKVEWVDGPIVDVLPTFETGTTVMWSSTLVKQFAEYRSGPFTFTDREDRCHPSRWGLFYRVDVEIEVSEDPAVCQCEWREEPASGFEGKGQYRWYRELNRERKNGKVSRRRTGDRTRLSAMRGRNVNDLLDGFYDDFEPVESFHPTSWADYRY